jgi:hypothetical protein
MRNYGKEKKQMQNQTTKTERKWRWIGHTFSKPQGAIQRHALDCNIRVQGREVEKQSRKEQVNGKC